MHDDFTALLADLEAMQATTGEMAKALKDDAKMGAGDEGGDDKIMAAAKDAGVDQGDDDDDDKKDDDSAEYFGKSFSVTMPDGSVQEAYDGTAAIAGIHERMDELQTSFVKAMSAMAAGIKGIHGLLGQQTELAKSLRNDVATLRNAGAGRRSSLTIHDKPGPATAAPAGGEKMTGQQVMAKAASAHEAGRLTAGEVARVEAYLGRGLTPPAEIMTKIA